MQCFSIFTKDGRFPACPRLLLMVKPTHQAFRPSMDRPLLFAFFLPSTALEELSTPNLATTIGCLLSLSRRSNPHTDVTFLKFHQWIRQAVSGRRTFRRRVQRRWLPGPSPPWAPSLCCLCNADKSIHQKISSVKLNQERSCQRERNRLN